MPPDFRRALQFLMGRVNDQVEDWKTAAVPDVVFQAQTMVVKWHNREGELFCKVCCCSGAFLCCCCGYRWFAACVW